MRNIVILLYGMAFFGISDMALASDYEPIAYADSKEEILKWGRDKYGLVFHEHVKADGKDILVVSVNITSGVYKIKLFVYLLASNKKTWTLLLTRETNTSHVTAKYNKGKKEIEIFSVAGKRLLSLPVEGLNLAYDPAEQVGPPYTTKKPR